MPMYKIYLLDNSEVANALEIFFLSVRALNHGQCSICVSHNLFLQIYQVLLAMSSKPSYHCGSSSVSSTNCLDWLTAIARPCKSQALRPKPMIMSIEVPNITSRQVYLTSTPSLLSLWRRLSRRLSKHYAEGLEQVVWAPIAEGSPTGSGLIEQKFRDFI